MARGRSSVAAKKPAVATADKLVAQWKEMRRSHGDDRVGSDLGITEDGPVVRGHVPSSGVAHAGFAQSEISADTLQSMEYLQTVVESAERGVLLADVSRWGAIAVWLLAWVQAMGATVEGGGNIVNEALKRIHDSITKKAAEGARLALLRREFDASALCFEHSYRDGDGEYVPVLLLECHEHHAPWTLVPYEGPAEDVPAIIYAPLMEMGRAFANDPGLDPELAQFKAVQIIASRCWNTARVRILRDGKEESLEAMTATGAPLVMRFTKDDHSITAATDCEVRDGSGNLLRVIPAISQITEAPCAPQELRTGGMEYMDFHWKGDNRAAETAALSHVHRAELVRKIVDAVSDGRILTDGRTGKPQRDAVIVAAVSALILDLRATNSLRVRLQDEEHADKYRNLTPNEIASDLTGMLGQPITRYQVIKSLEILELAEDDYWHDVHMDDEGSYLNSCHVCNPAFHQERDLKREARRTVRNLAKQAS